VAVLPSPLSPATRMTRSSFLIMMHPCIVRGVCVGVLLRLHDRVANSAVDDCAILVLPRLRRGTALRT
jgi:hypothetical protein